MWIAFYLREYTTVWMMNVGVEVDIIVQENRNIIVQNIS